MILANYLVQTVDGVLHCYWDKDLLRISLREHPKGEVLTLFMLQKGWGKTVYVPMTWEEAIS